MAIDFYKEAEAMRDQLVEWRRTIHQMPELGLELPKTSAYIRQELDKMGVSYRAGTNADHVIATIGEGSPCILIRGDMDALPMAEDSGEPFASTNGNMHACGHDTHATNMLGAAKMLKAHESELKGTVKLIFQTGEEIFEGSKAAIEDGVLENPHVDVAFGMHIDGAEPVGTYGYGYDAMAAFYGFRIDVKGKGAHGSYPSSGVSPINGAVHIYEALQEIISREVRPEKEAVLTVGSFHAGNVNNVIPETAYMEGTLRTFESELHQTLIHRIEEAAVNIGKAYRCEVTVTGKDCSPLNCDPEFTDEMVKYVTESDPNAIVKQNLHTLGSEDFANYTAYVPSTFLMFGGGLPEDDPYPYYPEHNPKVRHNEDCLAPGAAIYCIVATRWLEDHAK